MLSRRISRLYSRAVSHPCNACCDDSEHNTEDKEDEVFPTRWDSGTQVGPLRENEETQKNRNISRVYICKAPRPRPIQVSELINTSHHFHSFIPVTLHEKQVTWMLLKCVFQIVARHLSRQSISKTKGLKLWQLWQPLWRLENKVSFLCTLPKKKQKKQKHFVLSNLQKSEFDQVTFVKNNYKKHIQIQISSHWQTCLPMLVILRHLTKFSAHFLTNFQKMGKRRLQLMCIFLH